MRDAIDTVLALLPEHGAMQFRDLTFGVTEKLEVSRSYTHLFGIDFPYPYNFCPRDENMKYMRWVADNFAVRDRISFRTEVRSVIWNEAEQVWEITADTPEGSRTWKFNAVISCVESDPAMRLWLQDSARPKAHHEERPGRWLGLPQWPMGHGQRQRLALRHFAGWRLNSHQRRRCRR